LFFADNAVLYWNRTLRVFDHVLRRLR